MSISKRFLVVGYFMVLFFSLCVKGADRHEERKNMYFMLQQLSFLFFHHLPSRSHLDNDQLSSLTEWLHDVYEEQPQNFIRIVHENRLNSNDCLYALKYDQKKISIVLSGVYFMVLAQNSYKYLLFWLSKWSLGSASKKLYQWQFSNAFRSAATSGYLALKGFGQVREVRRSIELKRLFNDRKKNNQDMIYALQREKTPLMIN